METNDNKLTKELLLPVINSIANKKLDEALELLNQLEQKYEEDIIFKFKGSIFLKKKKWRESINNYERYLEKNNNKFDGYYNIGVAYFNLGQLSKAIDNFKISLNHNKENIQNYESLGITYKLIGDYEQSIKYYLLGLNLNTNHLRIIQNLIDTFNYYKPNNIKNYIIEINHQILMMGNKLNNQKIISKENILNLLENSNQLLNQNKTELAYFETQIFRKNKTNLNCKRHLSIFKNNKIIPKFCFDCFKVQIKLNNVIDLIYLFFYFNKLKLRNNNIRKCMVETRANVQGNYKGYIYCSGIDEAKEILTQVKKDINKYNIIFNKIEIKHGCTEYYKEYNLFESIKESNVNSIYKKVWGNIEKKFDEENFTIENNKERIFNNTINQYNLSDFLIIKNWLIYAKLTGDGTYKEIFKSDLKINFLDNILNNQIEIRKN